MRTLVFSDTHLTHHFDEGKYQLLQRIIHAADRVIINGDFWDAYHTTWEQFAQSHWRYLFPLLKERHAVYLYGNHDYEIWNPNPQLFSDIQADFWSLPVGKRTLYIEHGHRLTPSFNYYFPKTSRLIAHWLPYQRLSFSRAPWNLRASAKQQEFAAEHCQKNQILVCGHTHVEMPLTGKYVNLGFINYHEASYLTVEGDRFSLKHKTF